MFSKKFARGVFLKNMACYCHQCYPYKSLDYPTKSLFGYPLKKGKRGLQKFRLIYHSTYKLTTEKRTDFCLIRAKKYPCSFFNFYYIDNTSLKQSFLWKEKLLC